MGILIEQKNTKKKKLCSTFHVLLWFIGERQKEKGGDEEGERDRGETLVARDTNKLYFSS